MRTLSLLLILCISRAAAGQGVSAYSDNRKYFYAFDHGTFQQLEYLPIVSYRISGNSIAYVDNTREFKIYYEGQVFKQDIYAADFNYYSTGCIVPFKLGRALYVFDRGIRKSLTYYSTQFAAGDSILAYFDETSPGLYVYYNREVIRVEESLLQSLLPVTAGSNLVAYVDPIEYFKVYYRGQVTTLSQSPPINVKAGSDLLAFEDGYTNAFMVFYKGEIARLDDFPPVSYQTGYGILAYVNSLQEFRVLSGGGLRKISSYEPTFYRVIGNLVLYVLNNRFMVFYDGKEIELENYVPAEYKTSVNGVAYKDVSGRLKFFWKGELYTATFDVVTDFTLEGDVLSYETGPKHTRFFFNGKGY